MDWDIVTAGDTHAVARRLAHVLDGCYAPLHDRAQRVLVKQDEQELVIDVSPLQGSTIEEDVALRDFTVNAMAVPLTEAVSAVATDVPLTPILIDPLHGEQDLRTGTLRATSASALEYDPLRILRAVRFMTYYAFTLDPTTVTLIEQAVPRLAQVASERIHEELYAILRPAGATERLYCLDQLHVLTALLPELDVARGMLQPVLHHWDVFDHSLRTVFMLEALGTTLQQTPEEIAQSPFDIGGQGDLLALKELLLEAEEQHIFSFATLLSPQMKLAALLHDIGKPPTHAVDEEGNITFYHHPQAGVPLIRTIAKRLSISTHDGRLMQQVAAHHMRPGQLSQDPVTPRAIRRYFMDLGPNGIYVALVALADHLAMRGPEPLTIHWQRHRGTVRLLLTCYIRERDSILPPRLIQADELMRRYHLEPGPLIGQLLEAIAEAQAEGVVHSREDIFWFAEEKLHQLQSTGEK
ncbi:polynucleotide adenylyltransferase [Dictyobacter arantiisoli]|uniref:Polynucleotide adenylyltransferase n=1 Tax=Dictyobacter arantiisoli TaxID=2014874 RepID=A0A5A5T8I6_9CHLR|nr:polynucleotide adenylyltransferase [Dictyobacter arantiisoli]